MRNFSAHVKNISVVRFAYSWNIFRRLKRNFVSPHGHVISFKNKNFTGIIHYKQLLLTKFGRILRYSTDDVNHSAKLTHYWTINRELGETFYSFHEGEIGSKNSKKTTRQTTFAVWRIFAELNKPSAPKLECTRDLKSRVFSLTVTHAPCFRPLGSFKHFFQTNPI